MVCRAREAGEISCLTSLRGAKRRSNPETNSLTRSLDCFAKPVIGPRCARTRWLAMTANSAAKREATMQPHKIVSRREWIEARKAHMAHEKEFTRARDRLSEERRALPWVKVDKDYVFDGPAGKLTLADLFKGHNQLVVQ